MTRFSTAHLSARSGVARFAAVRPICARLLAALVLAALSCALVLAMPARAFAHPDPAPAQPSAAPGSTSGNGSSTAVDPALTQTVSGDEQLAPAGTPVEISSGHVDMGPRLTDAGWDFLVRDDSGAAPVWRSVDDVVFRVGEAARMEVPATDAYSFIHASGPAYVIPQQQLADVVWLGWNTQDPGVVSRVNGDVALTYGGHAGEGQFTAFVDSGNFSGPTLLWNSEVATSQPVHVSLNTHTHANWVFTQPGVHLVRLTVSAQLTDGTQVEKTVTLRFAVGANTSADDARAAQWPAGSDGAAASGSAADNAQAGQSAAGQSGTAQSGAQGSQNSAAGEAEIPLRWVVIGCAGAVLLIAAGFIGARASRRRHQDAALAARTRARDDEVEEESCQR
ncbi:choice-of-anchor M domain-containing protein [Actinotignum schaalii]|uniref:choice-of-anchor M domain-containing protein n=1 Tax=Actinotignum schaalii TaxID=59505 RepID=UPI00040C942E|nr:choice-of-anchor M domain-containing protein [Actinotignum schaalii]WQN44847.1 choice-of-anchor M domain-containing protein [Actinotignum schaalii]